MNATVNHTPGIVTITDVNTTIAYCRYTLDGEVEYIFVHNAHRRRGYARKLLAMVQATVCRRLRFQPPISPLGAALQRDYDARTPACTGCAVLAAGKELNYF